MRNSAELLYDGITNIDEELIEEAERYKPKVYSVNWARWGALAASLVIIAAGAFGLSRLGMIGMNYGSSDSANEAIMETETTEAAPESPEEYSTTMEDATEDTVEEAEDAAVFMKLDALPDKVYAPSSYTEIAELYDLTRRGEFTVTDSDLGEEMGEITESDDPSLIGCKVYHFAPLADNDDVCIVDRGGYYEFWIAS